MAFTGSLRGGRALFDAAAAPAAADSRVRRDGQRQSRVPAAGGGRPSAAPAIAEGYIQSVTMGVGQFCTNPGMVLGVADAGLEEFLEATARGRGRAAPATMLHAGIHSAFEQGVGAARGNRRRRSRGGVGDAGRRRAARSGVSRFSPPTRGSLDERPEFREEVFGPASVVFRCESVDQMYDIARRLDGHLTATIHGTEEELVEHAALVRILERKVGRIVFNGFPTGLEICPSMHHGGPYPATTHSHFTSIGQAAIYRFTRPVCYQRFPASGAAAGAAGRQPARAAAAGRRRVQLNMFAPPIAC